MNRIQFGRLSLSEIFSNHSHRQKLRNYAKKCCPPVSRALLKSLNKNKK